MEIHGIFSGRFQPITKKHEEIILRMSKENKTSTLFLVKGKKSSLNKELNPFPINIQKELILNILPKNVKLKIIPTGYFVDVLNSMPYNNFKLYTGTDRILQYKAFTKYLNNPKVLYVKEIKRDNEDVSATKIRNSLVSRNLKDFINLTPKKNIYSYNKLLEFIGIN